MSFRFKNATKVFGGPFYGIAEMITEDDFKELITPELEQVKRDIRSTKRSILNFYYFKPVRDFPLFYLRKFLN